MTTPQLTEASERLAAFSTAARDARSADALLELTLDTAVELLGADMGGIQIYDPGAAVLRLVAYRGFEPWFRACYAEVDAGETSACAHAMARRERVSFADVEVDNPDPTYRELARRAGYRAVQSTPLTTAAGA